jgi:rhodanese-related sulfurtransferase
MNELRKLFYLLLIIPIMFVNTSCSDDDSGTDPEVTNEAEVLAHYLEANENVLNTFFNTPQKMIKASDVKTNLDTQVDQYIIDIRAAADFANGHIQGAINVAAASVLDHYKTNNLDTKEVVVIACYSGQTAGWVSGLLRTAGYTNSRDLKWGMCSWNSTTSGSWTSASNVNNSRQTELVTAPTSKPAIGEFPVLSTGKTVPQEILEARVKTVFAEGFDAAKMTNAPAFTTPENYFILNYWSEAHYNLMHIPGAVQYTPGADLTIDSFLKTLPTDKAIAVYCYTGQTSAHVAAYLRVLGYDAKSILFGVNGMNWENIPANKFVAADEIHDYPLVK